MSIKIFRNGHYTNEAYEAFGLIGRAMGLAPDTVRAMLNDYRAEMREAGGAYVSEERADELWAEAQRRFGVPESIIEPAWCRRN